MNRLEGTRKKGSGPLVLFIEVHRISSTEFLHECRNPAIVNFPHEYVRMIRHETVSRNINQDFFARLREYIRRIKPLSATNKVAHMDGFDIVARVEQRLKAGSIGFIHEYDSLVDASRVAVEPFAGSELSTTGAHA